jgi:D-alanine-D-alanine ligase
VSIASATSVLKALDRDRYEPVPLGITRAGQWLIADTPEALLEAGEVTLELPETTEAILDVTHHGIVPINSRGGIDRHETAVDVVFPLLHGPYGEDGTVQGMLELADIPYVGAGVFASSAAMDKVHMKRLFREAGLPSVAWTLIKSLAWERDREQVLDDTVSQLCFPMFVKPCNLGSSVGISRASDRGELESAIELARRYDRRVIVEEGVDAREIECSVLGNDEPLVSVPGEVVSHHDFYDYESKYTEGLADLIIPAPLSPEEYRQVRDLAERAFAAVDAAGLARVDLFLRRADGVFLVNEINTMPGFTTTSMYPKLWEASGVSYSELIDRLIQLALERHRSRPEAQ